jgi:heme-degrading monooxygenase HmoA
MNLFSDKALKQTGLIIIVINIGFYYRVKKGKEGDFEKKFREVVDHLKANLPGFVSAKLYKQVDDPQEYLIYTEWESLDSFKKFLASNSYKATLEYGKSIIEGRPIHRIFQVTHVE